MLPAELRRRQGWGAGTRLVVEETPEGVLLRRSEPLFPPTRLDDVYGCLRRDAAPLSLEAMDAAVEDTLRQRSARGRY